MTPAIVFVTGDWLRTEVFIKLLLYYAQQDAKPESKVL
jgi:hypothetical protein